MELFFQKYRVEIMLATACFVAGIMISFSGMFHYNDYDWIQIHRGPAEILKGNDPFVPSRDTYYGTFNPPHLLVVGQPWILGSLEIWILTMVWSVGMLCVVTRRPYAALYLLSTPFLIYGVAIANVGIQCSAIGMSLLWLAQNLKGWKHAFVIAWAYGLLTVKPQMTGLILPLHFFWMYLQGRSFRELRQVVMVCIGLLFILPTIIAFITALAFQGEYRFIWWNWFDGVFFRDYDQIHINERDYESFFNKFGFFGSLVLTYFLAQVFIRRWNPAQKRNPLQWDWTQYQLTDVFQLGTSLLVIWMIYPDSTIVGLTWLLTFRPSQIVSYIFIVWWLAIWLFPSETIFNFGFIPVQAYYLIPIMLAFAEGRMAQKMPSGAADPVLVPHAEDAA